MRAPISVVIPTLNAEQVLADTLMALFEGVQAGLIRELIVVDGGSTDETVALVKEAGALVVHENPSRGGQLRAGCAVARGQWLLVLHADSVLDSGWSEAVSAHLKADTVACFRLRFDAGGVMASVTAGWANLRTRVFDLPFGDQGILIRQSDYKRIGGYPDQPLMEDIALVRALRGQLRMLDCYVTTSATKYQKQGWLRRGCHNIWLQLRYFCGSPPEVIARSYRHK